MRIEEDLILYVKATLFFNELGLDNETSDKIIKDKSKKDLENTIKWRKRDIEIERKNRIEATPHLVSAYVNMTFCALSQNYSGFKFYKTYIDTISELQKQSKSLGYQKIKHEFLLASLDSAKDDGLPATTSQYEHVQNCYNKPPAQKP
jgi:hypothetical protein